jgi:hypothetical protein
MMTPPPPPPPPTTSSIVTSSSSSSVFDGSIDHVWISFPEPPRHTHSTSNSSKRPRTSTTTSVQQIPTQKKLFSYTRYDWNFLSTLSPTVLGWFCVINRLQKPVEKFLHQREKRTDAILAYFLIETKPLSTLPQSRLYELFAPKTKYLLAHPVCQLVTELRKHFNNNTQINVNLQPNIVPEIQLLKQGIREACRGWAQTFKRLPQPNMAQPPSSSTTTTSPINTIIPTSTNQIDDQEQASIVKRARSPTITDRVQRLIGHEFVVAHPRRPSAATKQPSNEIDPTASSSAVRRRMTVQNTASNIKDTDTIIDMNNEPSSVPERRRASSFLGKVCFIRCSQGE